MNAQTFETELNGKKLSVEISNLAEQANGSVLVRYGETVVFATAVMSKNIRQGLSHFPLTVDYEERFYAAGMILGSRFIRREGRPTEEAVLTSRLIDRTVRPLFDRRLRNEVQVIVLALAVDNENDPDIPAVLASSLALGISDIPWAGPVAAVRMSCIENKFVVNPTYEERGKSKLNMVVCGKDGRINMIEAKGREAAEDVAFKVMERALVEIEKIQKFQEEIIKKIGKEKVKVDLVEPPADMEKLFKEKFEQELYEIVFSGKKKELNELKSEWMEFSREKFGEDITGLADDFYEEKINAMLHQEILEKEKRPDSRKINEIRPLYANVKILPIVHGSALFFRGGTHILSVVTLGGPKDVQWIEGMEIQTTKHFMHHYNFPPFSTGETGRMGGAGRREIGHGALVERALSAVVPDKELFPYTIRIVSEAMASNGSTSMGSVCASSLALMDTGVPIKNPVAGIAMGLIMENPKSKIQNPKYKILTDIQGPEDHHGDMDFKCAGTKEGITAIQMDVKVEGVTAEILEKTLMQAKKAREQILDVMSKVLSEPRKEISPNAPRIVKFSINPEKIGAVIGPGGKIINSIIEKTGTEIDIEQDGSVFVMAKKDDDIEKARKIIEDLTHEFAIGEVVKGKVTRLFDFGAMVGIGGEQEGLVHISELSPQRVEKVTDVVNVGDEVTAQIISIDERGRINLSIKRMNPNYDPSRDARNDGRNKRNHNNNRNRDKSRGNNFKIRR